MKLEKIFAFILTLFLPGAGQIIMKDYLKGSIMIILSMGIGFFTLMLFPFLYYGTMLWAFIDLYLKVSKAEGKSNSVLYLVMGIIGAAVVIPIIFYLFLYTFIIGGEKLTEKVFNSRNTDSEMTEISDALKKYHAHYKTYPTDYADFIDSKPIWSNWDKDSWGEYYVYQLIDSNNYQLVSSGKDREMGTDDDLIMINAK